MTPRSNTSGFVTVHRFWRLFFRHFSRLGHENRVKLAIQSREKPLFSRHFCGERLRQMAFFPLDARHDSVHFFSIDRLS
jgi:hypothetical protein